MLSSKEGLSKMEFVSRGTKGGGGKPEGGQEEKRGRISKIPKIPPCYGYDITIG